MSNSETSSTDAAPDAEKVTKIQSKVTKIQSDERESFERALSAIGDAMVMPDASLAAVRCHYKGEQRAMLTLYKKSRDDDDSVDLYPLALLLTDEMLEEVTPPPGAEDAGADEQEMNGST